MLVFRFVVETHLWNYFHRESALVDEAMHQTDATLAAFSQSTSQMVLGEDGVRNVFGVKFSIVEELEQERAIDSQSDRIAGSEDCRGVQCDHLIIDTHAIAAQRGKDTRIVVGLVFLRFTLYDEQVTTDSGEKVWRTIALCEHETFGVAGQQILSVE